MKYLRFFLFILILNGIQAQNISPSIKMELLINNSSNPGINQGFPLVFDITISNESARNLLIAKTIFEKEFSEAPDSIQFKIDSFITESKFENELHTWDELIRFSAKSSNGEKIDFSSRLHLLSGDKKSAILKNGSDLARISFGLDPENCVIFEPGNYEVKVGLNIDKTGQNPDIQWSNQVKLKVILPKTKVFTQITIEKKYFVLSYFLARKRCTDARDIVNSFESNALAPSEFLIMNADLSECEGDILKTLDYLNKALDIFLEDESEYEPPDLLWDRIEKLQNQIYK